MALTRLFVHDTFYDATDNFTYTPGMRLTLDNTTQSARITRLQNSGVVSTDETIDPSGVAITGGNIDGTVIGATTAAAGTFTTLTASGDVTFDTTTFVVDSTNNRVGIGTPLPTNTLTVSTSASQVARFDSTGGSSALVFSDNGSTNDFHQSIGSIGDAIRIVTGNTERFRVDVSGNVGINATLPLEKLHVGGNARINGSIKFDTFREIKQASSTAQGVGLIGGTSNTTGASISLYGSTNPSQAGNLYLSSGGAASTGDIIFRNYNGTSFNTHVIFSHSGGVNMANLPTSASGLSSGDLWNNSGVINIA